MAPIKIKYSEQCIREAIHSYWWKRLGWSFLTTLVLLTAFLVYRIANGDWTWVVGVLGFIVILHLAIMVGSYFLNIDKSLRQLRAMKVPEATLELEEEKFCITSDSGGSETNWSLIRDIWHSDKVWFLVLSSRAFVTLPIAELTQEAKSFIISKVEANDQNNNYINKQESILYRTRQAWKIYAMPVNGFLASLLIIGPWFIDSLSSQWLVFSNITGFSLLFGDLILLFTIRCPVCRSHWYSQAVRKQYSGRWPNWLLAPKECPTCGASGDDFTEEHTNRSDHNN